MSFRVHFRIPIIMALLSLVFSFTLAMLSTTTIYMLRLIIIAVDMLVIFSNFRYKKGIKNPEIWLYCLIIIVSGVLNYGFNSAFLSTAIYALMLLMIYLIFDCAKNKYGEDILFDNLFIFVAVIMSVVDAIIIATHGSGAHIDGRSDLYYYIGSKFTVSYYNMLFFAMILGRFKKKNIGLSVVISGVMIYINTLVDCMTGVTGILTILLMFLTKDKIERYIRKPFVAVVAVILSGMFALTLQLFTSIGPIRWFVIDVLKSDLDMTGRAGIFAVLKEIVLNKPLLGYGYGNTAVKNVLGYGNPQNGLFDILVNYGVLGAYAFINTVYSSFRLNYKDDHLYKMDMPKYVLMCFVYAMIICGAVEINFSVIFIMALALCKSER